MNDYHLYSYINRCGALYTHIPEHTMEEARKRREYCDASANGSWREEHYHRFNDGYIFMKVTRDELKLVTYGYEGEEPAGPRGFPECDTVAFDDMLLYYMFDTGSYAESGDQKVSYFRFKDNVLKDEHEQVFEQRLTERLRASFDNINNSDKEHYEGPVVLDGEVITSATDRP